MHQWWIEWSAFNFRVSQFVVKNEFWVTVLRYDTSIKIWNRSTLKKSMKIKSVIIFAFSKKETVKFLSWVTILHFNFLKHVYQWYVIFDMCFSIDSVNGDMIPDLLGENIQGVRQYWTFQWVFLFLPSQKAYTWSWFGYVCISYFFFFS